MLRGDREAECRAAIDVIFPPKPPAMGFDDRAADGKAHPKTVGFGGEKGFEHLLDGLSRQPAALVVDGGSEHAVVVHGGANQNLAITVAAVAHRFKGVEQEVEQDLLNLDANSTGWGKVGFEINQYPQASQCRVAVNQPHDFTDDCREVERGELG